MTVPLEARLPGPGTLALAGSGEYLPPMEPVDRFLIERLNAPARVVCLPTGAGTEGDERIQYWMDLGENYFKNLGVQPVESLRVIDRLSASDPVMAAKIDQANFVYLSGGKPQFLYTTLESTPVFAAIRRVLERGGVVAGCSAGAMIFGQRIPGSPFPWSWQDGFGYLSGTVIIPHFDELPKTLLAGIQPFARQYMVVGIDGNTSLVCTNEGCFARGKGGVTVMRKGERTTYRQED